MAERDVMVQLRGPDGTVSEVPGKLREFSPGERIRRGAIAMTIAVALAATLIPIPIVHILGIPLFLLGGIFITVRQLAAVARLSPLKIPCPRCGGVNRVGGGLGYRRIDRPMERMCEECRRVLTLTIR